MQLGSQEFRNLQQSCCHLMTVSPLTQVFPLLYIIRNGWFFEPGTLVKATSQLRKFAVIRTFPPLEIIRSTPWHTCSQSPKTCHTARRATCALNMPQVLCTVWGPCLTAQEVRHSSQQISSGNCLVHEIRVLLRNMPTNTTNCPQTKFYQSPGSNLWSINYTHLSLVFSSPSNVLTVF